MKKRGFRVLLTLVACLAVAGCAHTTARAKSSLQPGMTSDEVRTMLGGPDERSFRGANEAWQYADVVGFGQCEYLTVWLSDGVVQAVTTRRGSSVAGCGLGSIPVDWSRMPTQASTSPPPKANETVSTGTGFLVDGHGTVVTSNHVVAGAKSITARCTGSASVPATVSATNQSIDIAVLSIGTKNPTYLSLARPRSATVGQRIFTYGYPVTDLLGGDPKFTDGVISALSGIGGEQSYLQISIPVQPGNSGGPVVNEKGEVVGIVSAGAAIAPFLSNTGTLPQNMNWAVKAEYAALMFDAPPSQPGSASREAAIKHVEECICFIEAR